MSDEFYKKHRPQTLDQIAGNPATVQVVNRMITSGKFPHAILLVGPSGCGKTTLGRIIATAMGCHPSEYEEVDSGQFRGVDTARDLREKMVYAPQKGKVRVWLIDEAHQQTKDQQNAMLKALEDTPKHVYFMLATTDPDKVIKAIHTRCTKLEVSALDGDTMAKRVLWPIVQAEKLKVSKEVLLSIGGKCAGSCRAAINMLEAVAGLGTPEQQLEALKRMTMDEEQVGNIANALLKGAPWPKVYPLLKDLPGDPESIRRGVLGYATAAALGWMNNPQGLKSCKRVLVAFEKNYFDSGKAGLLLSCMDACGVGD